MVAIKPVSRVSATVSIPGSKSLTHRAFILASLSDGPCRIHNPLKSEDTELTLKALRRLGVAIEEEEGEIRVQGTGGRLRGDTELFLGNCGTGIRLLTAVTAIASGKSILTGNERMGERPMSELISGLRQMGAKVRSLPDTGCPPLEVVGDPELSGGQVSIKGQVSSQFISAILVIAPLTRNGVTLEVSGESVSRPYIDLTLFLMEQFGVSVSREGYEKYRVAGKQSYKARDYTVEPDVSNASYFWGAAGITGGRVTVRDITTRTRQGDIRVLRLLESMGCGVEEGETGITVTGGKLRGIEADMGDIPDMVPTLAVLAAFAEGTTRIHNIAHLRSKESDRVAAIAQELGKMGVRVTSGTDSLEIRGGNPHGAEIQTYNDHRIAMAFSLAGLKVPGIRILDERCVEKSFPTYWQIFNTLYEGDFA